MNERNVLLMGLPRSGTTLVCHLLNKLPDTVALSEPWMGDKATDRQSTEEWLDLIDQFLKSARESLLTNGTAITKHIGGQVPDNPAEDRYPGRLRLLLDRLLGRSLGEYARGDLRRIQVSMGIITVEKTLSSDFLLCVKNNPLFTAMLGRLRSRYPCYALVRNPLATLASWNSVAFPGWDGRSLIAEHVDRDLAQRLVQIDDRIERQMHLLLWWFEKYHDVLPPENILRYEDIVASGGAALRALTPHAVELREPLENKNANELYDRELMKVLGERLLRIDGPFWRFYPRESVRRLLEHLEEAS